MDVGQYGRTDRRSRDSYIAKWTICVKRFFFWPKISQVAIIKTRSAGIAFFFPSFPSLRFFFSLLSFSFVTVTLELLGLEKTNLWRLFTQMTTNFVRLVFKKLAIYIYIYISRQAWESVRSVSNFSFAQCNKGSGTIVKSVTLAEPHGSK